MLFVRGGFENSKFCKCIVKGKKINIFWRKLLLETLDGKLGKQLICICIG